MSMNAYLDAVDREKRAWQALDGRLPGMTGCTPALWAEWVDATAELNVELARYTQGEGMSQPGAGNTRNRAARAA